LLSKLSVNGDVLHKKKSHSDPAPHGWIYSVGNGDRFACSACPFVFQQYPNNHHQDNALSQNEPGPCPGPVEIESLSHCGVGPQRGTETQVTNGNSVITSRTFISPGTPTGCGMVTVKVTWPRNRIQTPPGELRPLIPSEKSTERRGKKR